MKTLVVVSGYFNPVHRGHVRMFRHARQLGDKLLVIVNNDRQQTLKKGKVIMTEDERMEVVAAMRDVDEVVLSIDSELPVIKTLEFVAIEHSAEKLIFANGGDRSSPKVIPETPVCEEFHIEMRFGVGGEDKPQSSTHINKALGHE